VRGDRISIAAACAGVLAVSLLARPAAIANNAAIHKAPAAGTCRAGWIYRPSPSTAARENALLSVAAMSKHSLWAVGDRAGSTDVLATSQTLVLHHQGTRWHRKPSPDVSPGNNFLTGVIRVARGSALAVGAGSSHGLKHALVEQRIRGRHHSRWHAAAIASPGSSSILYGVAATSPHDVWTVGEVTNGTRSQTNALILHRGRHGRFRPVAPAAVSGTNRLFSVASFGRADAWAVGSMATGLVPQPLAEHWDGATWHAVPVPSVDTTRYMVLTGVAGTSGSDVWVVGERTAYDGTMRATALHWDGSAWTVTPTPISTAHGPESRLMAVVAVSPRRAYAVGSYFDGVLNRAMVLRWNGRRWHEMLVPRVTGFGDTTLFSVTEAPNRQLWAVGGAGGHTITYHYCP
jgi:hypothetical protein